MTHVVTHMLFSMHPQAKEFGVPEVWMNERIMRIAPKSFAEFLYAFEEECAKGPDLLWLVWRYEGDFTLFDLLQVLLFWLWLASRFQASKPAALQGAAAGAVS